MTLPRAEVRNALAMDCDERVEAFSRLYKDGTLYHSTDYTRASRNKRDDTICSFCDASSGFICFGRIELFVMSPTPFALLRMLQPLDKSLINEAGHPCRPQLTLYCQVDLLSSYIVPVAIPTSSTPLISISLDHYILSKAVLVSVSSKHYVIAQPNNVEYH